MREILLTDAAEIAAVVAGALQGTQYRDGEVYADVAALQAWREKPVSDAAVQRRLSREAMEGKR